MINYLSKLLYENLQCVDYVFSSEELSRFNAFVLRMKNERHIEISDIKHFEQLVKGYCKWIVDYIEHKNHNALLFGNLSVNDHKTITLYLQDPRHAPNYSNVFDKCLNVPGIGRVVDFDLYRGISDLELESIQKRLERGTKNLELTKSKSFSSSYKHAYSFAKYGGGSAEAMKHKHTHNTCSVITLHASKPILDYSELLNACYTAYAVHILYDSSGREINDIDDMLFACSKENEYIVSSKDKWELIDLEKLEFKC